MNARQVEFRQELQKVVQIHFGGPLTLPGLATVNGLDQLRHFLFGIMHVVVQGGCRLTVLLKLFRATQPCCAS